MMKNPAKPLVEWYKAAARDLPWRETRNPYFIWISEIILQQTRVAQGTDYYLRFIKQFPDVQSLANASLDQVLKQWEGLGYYSRARNLHHSAKEVANERKGVFPTHYKEWETLKGIGPYTARAIGSIVNGNKVAVVDGNVFRVLSRYLGDFSPINQVSTKQKFQEILDNWIQKADPLHFNQGMMELGATICLPRNPVCGKCPLQKNCVALKDGSVHLLPVKDEKAARKTKYFQFYLTYNSSGKFMIRRRPENAGIWAGLFEIPNEEVAENQWNKGIEGDLLLGEMKHVFTHFDMKIKVYKQSRKLNSKIGEQFIDRSEIRIFAFSRAVQKIFSSFLEPEKMKNGKIRS